MGSSDAKVTAPRENGSITAAAVGERPGHRIGLTGDDRQQGADRAAWSSALPLVLPDGIDRKSIAAGKSRLGEHPGVGDQREFLGRITVEAVECHHTGKAEMTAQIVHVPPQVG